MSKSAHALDAGAEASRELAPIPDDSGTQATAERQGRARPIPRIAIHAFCEEQSTAAVCQLASEDRRLAKAHVTVNMGGVAEAAAFFQEQPTPNLIIIESTLPRQQMLAELDRLAECCDPGTKVIVIGHQNDVVLYRELLKRGVAEYLIAPLVPLQLMESISNLYTNPESDPVGNVVAFIGSKGGVGSSTVCHNTAWAISEVLKSSVVIADLDLAFGTAGLDFNQDPVQGIADALSAPERLDEVLLDRLLTKCSEHLSLFAAPVTLDKEYDLAADACDAVLGVVRQNMPYVIVDLPHVWTSWSKRILTTADEIVVTAAPDLANLRNAKNLIELVKASRSNDGPPHLVINLVGTPKRPEIPVAEFEDALGIKAKAVIEFDPETFGMAANNGQMIEEMNPKAKAGQQFRDLARVLAKRVDHSKPEKKPAASPLAQLMPLLEKLKIKKF